MKKALSWVLVVSLLMVSALGAAGCGSSAPAQPATSSQGATKVLTSGQNVVQTSVPLIAGESLGVWKKTGMDVKRISYASGPPQLEANPAGDWQIGWIGATAGITGILKYNMKVIGLSGYDFSNVAFAREDSDIVKAGDKGIKGVMGTANEWKGKKIIVGVGTVNYVDLLLTLKALGLTPGDVTIINMDISAGMQAFLSGSGDIWYGSSTYATQVSRKPGYKIVHSMAGMDAAMSGNMIASRDYLNKNEDTVVKYLAGALEVLLWLADAKNADKSADEFVRVLKEDFGVNMTHEDALASMKQTGFKDLKFYEGLCEVGSDGLTGLQREYKKYFEYHVMTGAQKEASLKTVLDAVDSSYLKKAIELYKKEHKLN